MIKMWIRIQSISLLKIFYTISNGLKAAIVWLDDLSLLVRSHAVDCMAIVSLLPL